MPAQSVGASLGGPVRKNRPFFADYEGRRARQGITQVTNVPTPAERNGDFSNDPPGIKSPIRMICRSIASTRRVTSAARWLADIRRLHVPEGRPFTVALLSNFDNSNTGQSLQGLAPTTGRTSQATHTLHPQPRTSGLTLLLGFHRMEVLATPDAIFSTGRLSTPLIFH